MIRATAKVVEVGMEEGGMVMEIDPKKLDVKRTMTDQVWRRRVKSDFLGDRVVVGTYLQKESSQKEGFGAK